MKDLKNFPLPEAEYLIKHDNTLRDRLLDLGLCDKEISPAQKCDFSSLKGIKKYDEYEA
jgi:hypothetical protein